MAGADPGAELAAAEHGEAEHSEPDGEMASSSLTGLLTNRSRGEQHSAANYSGDRGASTRQKDGYAMLQIPPAKGGGAIVEGEDGLNDDFYDEQLRSDGWHLDETSDDEQLDFSLPKALPSKQQSAACECAPNAAALRRIRTRVSEQCTVM